MGFQKLNKKGVGLRNAFFAIIIASVAIIAIGAIIGEWGTKYDSGINYDLSEYDKLDEMSKESQLQKDKITPQDANPGSDNFESTTFRGGYGILGRIFSPFTSVFNMLESLELKFGLPPYIVEAVLTLMFFALIFAIIGIIFRLGKTP